MQTTNTNHRDCSIYNLLLRLILVIVTSTITSISVAQKSVYSQSDTTQIIVKYKQKVQGAAPQAMNSLAIGSGIRIKQRISFSSVQARGASPLTTPLKNQSNELEFDVIEIVDKSISIEQAVDQLIGTGLFEYVEPDYPINLDRLSNDPLLPSQWGLDSDAITNTDADANAFQAWDISTGNPDVVVAVLDTGIDYRHPDLIENIWINTAEIANDGLDNDGNGVIDDIHGLDARNQDGDPLDERGHGTHVAGILAAKGNNNLGISGMGWNLKLMPVQIFGSTGNGSTSDAISGLSYVHMMKTQYGVNVKVTNNSWGGGFFSQALKDTIRLLAENDIMFVASAGNDAVKTDYRPYYPASYGLENIITVGAVGPDSGTTLEQTHRPLFSNTGFTSVDLAAPGVDIISTKMENGLRCQTDSGTAGYSICSGTSMAVPFVSATLGLLTSSFPNSSLFAQRQRVIRSVGFSPSSVEQSWNDQNQQWSRTGGILKADKALLYDGFTLEKDYLSVEALRNLKQPQDQVFNESFNLGALRAQGINWGVTSDASWLSATKNSGVVSDSLTESVPIEITTANQDIGIYRGRLTFSDISADVTDVSVPVRLTIKTEPESVSPQVLNRPAILNSSKQYGSALVIQGDQAFIAETSETGGAVHRYQYFDKFWIYMDSIFAPDRSKLSSFGNALAISGDTLLVGAELDDTNGTFAGAVYVYEKSGNQWQFNQKITALDASFKFGTKLAFDNNNLAVMGARNVYLFKRTQGQWNAVQTIKTIDNTIDTNLQGDIALEDDVLLITRPDMPQNALEPRADVYEYVNNNWLFVKSLIDNSGFDYYLGDVDIHAGKILIISKPANPANDPGIEASGLISFRLYERSSGNWPFVQYDLPSGRDGVGFKFTELSSNASDSVILTNDSIYVSSVFDHHYGNGSSGALYRYLKTNNGYQLAGKFVPDINLSSSNFDFGFGSAIAVFGQQILVAGAGSPAHDAHVEVFDFTQTGRLQSLVLNQVNDQWQQVSVSRFYDSMIPVCSVGYVNNTSPVVVRVKKIQSSSFEIKLQNPGNLNPVVNDTVYCIIAEEGAWILPNGSMFEAKKYKSSLTAVIGDWGKNTDYRAYINNYNNPVVLGQVISQNDSDWSVFWSRGSQTSSSVDKTILRTGKHVGEDFNQFRNEETIGYMVFESGLSQIGTVDYQAGITGQVIQHLTADDNPVRIDFQGKPRFAIVSQSGIDGGNGSWPVLKGIDALSDGELIIAVDEDQIADDERIHIDESVGYFTASSHLDISLRPVPVPAKN